MNFQIKISIQDDIDLTASLNESQTGKLIWNALPIEGAVAYWPPGQASCLFYGPTPASQQGEIGAAPIVNLLGYMNESIEILNRVKLGGKIVIEKIDENVR